MNKYVFYFFVISIYISSQKVYFSADLFLFPFISFLFIRKESKGKNLSLFLFSLFLFSLSLSQRQNGSDIQMLLPDPSQKERKGSDWRRRRKKNNTRYSWRNHGRNGFCTHARAKKNIKDGSLSLSLFLLPCHKDI